MTTNLSPNRILLLALSISGLAIIYLFQHFNYLYFFTTLINETTDQYHPNFVFVFNRSVRFLLNDLLAILLIYAIFFQRKYVIIGFIIQLFGLLIILPIYFYFKLSFEGDSEISSPLLSFIHRIVIHPIIILLLIPAFYYQSKLK